MTLGRLTAKFVFGRNALIYHGPQDPVQGHIVLFFSNAPGVTDLSGPLRLQVILEGTLKTHIDRSKPLLTRSTQLCRQDYVVYDDIFQISAGEVKDFPFTASFPEYTNAIPELALPNSPNKRRRIGRCRLPPSFHRGSQLAWKKATGVAVSYQLRCEVAMAERDIEVHSASAVLEYELPLPDPDSLDTNLQLENTWNLASKQLFPQTKHSSGLLKDIGRSLFVDNPMRALVIRCVGIPQRIFVGQRLEFDVQMLVRDQPEDHDAWPEVWLDSCTVTVRGLTRFSQADRLVTKIGYADEYREIDEALIALATNIQPSGLFDRENHFSKVVTTEPLGQMSSGFSLGKISHKHKLLIRMRIRAANQELGFTSECNVKLYATALDGSQSRSAGQEQLPGYACGAGEADEELPGYARRDEGAEELPGYE